MERHKLTQMLVTAMPLTPKESEKGNWLTKTLSPKSVSATCNPNKRYKADCLSFKTRIK